MRASVMTTTYSFPRPEVDADFLEIWTSVREGVPEAFSNAGACIRVGLRIPQLSHEKPQK